LEWRISEWIFNVTQLCGSKQLWNAVDGECWYNVWDTYVQTRRLYYHCKMVLTLSMLPEVSAFFFLKLCCAYLLWHILITNRPFITTRYFRLFGVYYMFQHVWPSPGVTILKYITFLIFYNCDTLWWSYKLQHDVLNVKGCDWESIYYFSMVVHFVYL